MLKKCGSFLFHRPKLPQVVVKMLVVQHLPFLPVERAEVGMRWGGLRYWSSTDPVEWA